MKIYNKASIGKDKKDKLVFLALFLICIIFLIFGIKEVYRIDYLYSYDPFYHMNIAKNIDSIEPMATTIKTYDGGQIEINYPTTLRLLTVIINKITDISYLNIYKMFGLFCRILTVLVIYITVKYLVKNKVAAILASILFLSSHYAFLRSLITFPENLVLPFHVLIFYDVIRAIREKKIPYTLPIFLAASTLIHYRSIVISIILVGSLFIHKIYSFIKSKKFKLNSLRFKAVIRLAALLFIFIFLTFPVLSLTLKQYKDYLETNIGEEAAWASYIKDDFRYILPPFTAYWIHIGIVLSICSFISVFLLFYKFNIEKFTLLMWLSFTFILTRGTKFNIYVPWDRMLMYFIIPSVIISSYLLKKLIVRCQKNKIILASSFSIILVLPFIINAHQTHGWQGVKDIDIKTYQWVNKNISPEKSVIINKNMQYINVGLENFSLIETREEKLEQIFKGNGINQDKLKSYYPNKSVYLVVKKENMETDIEDLIYDIVYEQNNIRIYKISN